MGSGMHKNTLKNIEAILNLLREVGQIHIRGISRDLKLNTFIVSHIIEKYLDYFVETRTIEEFGFKARLVRFKPGMENTALDDVLRYVNLKKKIKNRN
jgi:hypothetical protein